MTGSLTRSGPKINLRRRLAMTRSLGPEGTSRDSRDDGDLVLLRHFRLEARTEPDVLVVEVHVHELPELAILVEEAVFEPGIAPVQRLDRRPDVGAFDGNGHLTVREPAEGAGNSELRHS